MKRPLKIMFSLYMLIVCSCSSENDINEPTENPSLKITNEVDSEDNGNNYLGADDLLTYSITVTNNGDVPLTNLTIVSTLKNLSDTNLNLTTPITFIGSDSGSGEGTLQTNETATYTANYTITQSDVDAGGISHSLMATAVSPENNSINDISDDGDNNDGNTSDDATITPISDEAFDPTIIAEYHILNSEGNPTNRYKFDSNGRFKELQTFDKHYYFTFNDAQQLTNLTTTTSNGTLISSEDIIYDANNRVIQIGDRNFEFYESDNYYIETETYSIDGPYLYEDFNGDTIEEYEINYFKYSLYDGNPIVQLCYYYGGEQTNTNTGEESEWGYCSDFEANQYTNNIENICSDTDCVDFWHDSNTNPLYGTTNLIDIYGFIRMFGEQPSKLDILISANNLTGINYSDPSQINFLYTYNDYNLPYTVIRQYQDELGIGSESDYAIYYYQGDIIPE
ncbi:MAG: hypothetical protein GYB32_08550 [Algicola sp.]|nr:hypothetical protein [Algicola sp.]